MNKMEQNGAVRRRCCLAERERDVAIDEAVAAYYELGLSREEVASLRREKAAWEAGKDAWSQRHQQLLWHVGNMAEVLWHAMRQDDNHTGDKVTTVLTVEEARLLALQSLEQLTIKSDAQLYEEMHDLYAKIAHMEIQQSRLMEKIRELKALNVKLATTIENNDEKQQKPDRFQADDVTKVEQQRLVEGVPTEEAEDLSRGMTLAGTQEAADRETRSHAKEDEATVALLQAQLAMYVNFTKRHNMKAEQLRSSGPQDEHATI